MARLLFLVSTPQRSFVNCADCLYRWEQNEVMINASCDALGYSGVPNPTSEELDGILDAIAAESKESGLDQRFILAIVVSSQNLMNATRVPADFNTRCKNRKVACEQSPQNRLAMLFTTLD